MHPYWCLGLASTILLVPWNKVFFLSHFSFKKVLNFHLAFVYLHLLFCLDSEACTHIENWISRNSLPTSFLRKNMFCYPNARQNETTHLLQLIIIDISFLSYLNTFTKFLEVVCYCHWLYSGIQKQKQVEETTLILLNFSERSIGIVSKGIVL